MLSLECHCLSPELMIARSEVYLRKSTSTLNMVEQVINHGDVILIIGCDFDQLAIVNAYSERTNFYISQTILMHPMKTYYVRERSYQEGL